MSDPTPAQERTMMTPLTDEVIDAEIRWRSDLIGRYPHSPDIEKIKTALQAFTELRRHRTPSSPPATDMERAREWFEQNVPGYVTTDYVESLAAEFAAIRSQAQGGRG